MKVRYTRRALRQLAEILDYIDARSPQGALAPSISGPTLPFPFLAAALAMVIGKP